MLRGPYGLLPILRTSASAVLKTPVPPPESHCELGENRLCTSNGKERTSFLGAARPSSGGGRSVGTRSIRRLEEAGIRSLEDLAPVEIGDLVRLGIRRDFAEQICAYVSKAGHGLPRP